jgi:D-alanyl-D-alanine carboxypeptidase/D-alanyl-D-alanine-endopeptidase (penicillin-binding protein 4)
MEDGSGLSRNNLFSSEKMAQVLRYVWQNEQTLQLIALLPRSGESGTLKYRRSMRKEPIKGALSAKSGSVYGSYNMAGYGLDSDGSPSTLFVQFIADYHPRKRKSDEPKVVAPLTQFENLFYQDVIKFSQAMPKK